MSRLLAFLSLVYLLLLTWHFSLIALGVRVEGSLGLLRELTLYFFAPAPLLFLAGLVARARIAILLSLLPLALFVALYAPRFAPRTQPTATGPTFRVLTFNAGAGAGEGAPASVLAAVQAVDADIVALQEVPGPARQLVGTTLEARYPYHTSTPDVTTFSAYPLADPAEIHLGDSIYVSQSVDILLGERVVRLANVHLRRSGPSLAGRRSLAAFVRNYRPDLLESQVVELLDRYIRPVVGTQLLAGDFNQTDWSRPYALLADALRDSFQEAGRGFGHSYPSTIGIGRQQLELPLVRIDYLFHSDDLVVLEARIGPDGGSDHLPVVADLAFLR